MAYIRKRGALIYIIGGLQIYLSIPGLCVYSHNNQDTNKFTHHNYILCVLIATLNVNRLNSNNYLKHAGPFLLLL